MTFKQIYVLNRFLLYVKLYKANVNSKYLNREFTNFLWCREMATATCSEGGGTPKQVAKNRLANEKSPYLLQHATNPVNWYPWCQEALDKAKEENKLIFLSIGYSTCHWCHVMEKESFERQEIGDIMNMHYVNIKVDREERPDVDKVYMTYVQATTGSGGWPLSVWLTPNLNPIYGGTYFPTGDRHYGKPGFKTILLAIAEKESLLVK